MWFHLEWIDFMRRPEIRRFSDTNEDSPLWMWLSNSRIISAALFIEDPVFKLHAPGKYMNYIDQWNEIMQQMGGEDASTALWPNYPVRLPKEVSHSVSKYDLVGSPEMSRRYWGPKLENISLLWWCRLWNHDIKGKFGRVCQSCFKRKGLNQSWKGFITKT